MRGGERPHNARQAVLPTPLTRDPDSLPEAAQIWDVGFNASVSQWPLHVRGRNWVEGRIAKCPPLQQKSTDLLMTELAVIVPYS
jgi:hypothetical protein